MKPLIKAALAAVTLSAFGSPVVFADDTVVHTEITQRQQEIKRSKSRPTVAVYAREQSVGQSERPAEQQRDFQWKSVQVGNGMTVNYRVPAH